MNRSPRAMARAHARMARGIYEREGHVTPVLAVYGERTVVVGLAPSDDEDVPSRMAQAAALLVAILRAELFVTVTQAYIQTATPEQAERIDQGEDPLSVLEGTEQQTALLTVAWTDEETYSVTDKVLTESSRPWLREETPGLGEGRLADLMTAAWTIARSAPPPDEANLEMVLSVLSEDGIIGFALVQEGAG